MTVTRPVYSSPTTVKCCDCQKTIGPKDARYLVQRWIGKQRKKVHWRDRGCLREYSGGSRCFVPICQACFDRQNWGLVEHACSGCGQILYVGWGVWRGLTWSEECRLSIRRKRNRESMRTARAQAKKEQQSLERSCLYCNRQFTPLHPDARYCTGACRQAAYRRRARA
jgi:hypothetical protein